VFPGLEKEGEKKKRGGRGERKRKFSAFPEVDNSGSLLLF